MIIVDFLEPSSILGISFCGVGMHYSRDYVFIRIFFSDYMNTPTLQKVYTMTSTNPCTHGKAILIV